MDRCRRLYIHLQIEHAVVRYERLLLKDPERQRRGLENADPETCEGMQTILLSSLHIGKSLVLFVLLPGEEEVRSQLVDSDQVLPVNV
jgi:hypothetical protein